MSRAAGPLQGTPGELRIGARPEAERAAIRRIAGAMAAAIAVTSAIALLLQALAPPDLDDERRSTLSARADAFRGIFEVARRLGFQAVRHTRSYALLPEPRDSVLVILDPIPAWRLASQGRSRLDGAQVRALETWIRRGGRVIASLAGRTMLSAAGFDVESPLDRALEETPLASMDAAHVAAGGDAPRTEWAIPTGSLEGAGSLDGLRDEWPPLPERAASLAPSHIVRRGAAGVRLELPPFFTRDEPAEMAMFARPLEDGFEPLLEIDGRPIAARKDAGEGSVCLVSSSYPFTNLAIGRGGTGFAVAALLHDASDGRRRRLVFDEYCHGLSPRRGLLGWITGTDLSYPASAAVLLLLVLAWRGAVRPGAPREPRTVPRRAKEEFVMSLADMALRGGRHRAAARWILDAHRVRLRGALAGESDEAPGRAEDPDVAMLAARVSDPGRFGEADLRRFSRRADEVFAALRGASRKEENGRR